MGQGLAWGQARRQGLVSQEDGSSGFSWKQGASGNQGFPGRF
ncbi:MAG TPA: hypothetical protein PK684_04285 [Bacillota bacterium]|nr:hypothetical protein [Bacillota bacterium]